MTENVKEHVKDAGAWKRLLIMLLFAVLYSVAEVVITVVVVFQFLSVIITGKTQENVQQFGAQLSAYAYQVFRFLTYNSEELPYPFSDWPSGKPLTEEAEKPKRRAPARKPRAKKAEPKAAAAKPAARPTEEGEATK